MFKKYFHNNRPTRVYDDAINDRKEKRHRNNIFDGRIHRDRNDSGIEHEHEPNGGYYMPDHRYVDDTYFVTYD